MNMCPPMLVWFLILHLVNLVTACPSELCRCSTRQVIVCSHRRLERVPHFAREMDQIYEELDLSQNEIYVIPAHVFDNVFVKSIMLNNNQLIGISPRAFDGIEDHLEKLDLHSTDVEVLHWAVFRKLHNLKELNMAQNKLFALPVGLFDGLSDLVTMTFHQNKISRLKRGVFHGLGYLHDIDLSDNRISIIDDGVFEDLRRLKVLNLNNNVIHMLSHRSISGLDSLEELYLDINQLSNISPSSFSLLPSLTTLSIQHNNLTQIHAHTFSGAPLLHNLYLDNNRLRNISNQAFQSLRKLKTLSLESNNIQSLGDTCIPSGLKSLTALNLADNHLDCSCKIGWIYELIMNSGTYVSGRCESPAEHKNVFVRQLNFTLCLKDNCYGF